MANRQHKVDLGDLMTESSCLSFAEISDRSTDIVGRFNDSTVAKDADRSRELEDVVEGFADLAHKAQKVDVEDAEQMTSAFYELCDSLRTTCVRDNILLAVQTYPLTRSGHPAGSIEWIFGEE